MMPDYNDAYARIISARELMRKHMDSIAGADPYYVDNSELIVNEMSKVWDALPAKPLSMHAWAAEVWALHKASLE